MRRWRAPIAPPPWRGLERPRERTATASEATGGFGSGGGDCVGIGGIERHRSRLTTLPRRMTKKEIVRIIKERWRTERAYEELKGELGFDHFEGRSFPGWHHHVTVVLCCYAFVVSERLRHFSPLGLADPGRSALTRGLNVIMRTPSLPFVSRSLDSSRLGFLAVRYAIARTASVFMNTREPRKSGAVVLGRQSTTRIEAWRVALPPEMRRYLPRGPYGVGPPTFAQQRRLQKLSC